MERKGKNELKSKKVFILWAIVGPFFLLVGIITEMHKDQIVPSWQFQYSILYELLKNIGVAISISSIFSYILGTHEFIQFITDKLINVIISKEFVNKLNYDERKDLLRVILKPSKALSDIYSGISKYFNRHIETSLLLFHKHFRSGYSIIGHVYIDTTTGRMTVETDLNYRIYKVLGEYENLAIGFEDEDSKVLYTKLFSPTGDEHVEVMSQQNPKEKLEDEFLRMDPSIKRGANIIIPESFRQHDQIDVSRRILEYGQDHWHLYTYRASLPCDKFNLNIRCDNGIEIRKCITFGPSENFKVVNEGNKISVACNDWMQPGLGVSILFAKQCEANNGALPIDEAVAA